MHCRKHVNAGEEVFRGKLEIEDAKVESMYRIGRKQEGKVRPLTVKVTENYVKWGIVKSAKKLKNAREEMYNHMWIVPDRTRKEREEHIKLTNELQDRRKEGGRWIIRGRRVVKLDENRESNADHRNYYRARGGRRDEGREARTEYRATEASGSENRGEGNQRNNRGEGGNNPRMGF